MILSDSDLAVVEQAKALLTAGMTDPSDRLEMSTYSSAVNYLRLLIGDRPVETFVVLFLDARFRLIECQEMNTGTIDQTLCFPRAITQKAMNNCARHVVISHNHPSGSPKPSDNDIEVTRSLRQALHLFDISLLDHIVIGRAPGFPAWSITDDRPVDF